MIIVSQDKETIVNFDNIVTLYVIKDCISEEKGFNGYNIDYSTNDEINITIATYKTKERAIEVLQEIIKFYEVSERYKCSSNDGITIFMQKTFVYEMPGE